MANPNPNDDTEFNDALRRHGILPPKQELEVTEEDIASLVDQAIQERMHGKAAEDRTLDELDEIEDELDERVFEEFRRKRMQELQAKASRERFGDLVQVSESQYKNEINNAGTGVWVVVCLFQQGIPACGLLLQRLQVLARKFKATKFVKITATDAIRNYPDRNCPTLLIYYEGDLKRQLVGLSALGGLNTTEADVEWYLKTIGAVESDMEEAPRSRVPLQDAVALANLVMNDDD